MIISKECIEAINYIAKIYSCFKSPDDVIRGMLRDFARNTDNDVIIDILKTKTCKKIALVYADKLQDYKDKIDDCSDEIELYANDIEKTIDSLKNDNPIERDRRETPQKDRRIKARIRVGVGVTPDV